MNLKSLVYIVLIAGLFSCQNKKKETEHQPENKTEIKEEVKEVVPPKEDVEKDIYTIDDDAFFGITVGTKIASLPKNKIKKSTTKNAQGGALVYEILSEDNEKIGYFHPEPLNESLVGNIMVISPKAVTKEGIKIGTTYKEIASLINTFEVHGSEIESKTHVFYGNLGLQIDYPSNTYKLDKSKIPENSKVTQIWIKRIISRVKK